MLDGVPLLALGRDGVLVLLIAFMVIQIIRGKLVPRSALDDEREDTDLWRQAHAVSEAARVTLSDQVTELLEHARTTDALLRSITERKQP